MGPAESVVVPTPHRFIEAADCQDWQLDEGLSFANMMYREPTCLLISERILPLPQIIRKSLIEVFCPENMREEALTSRESNNSGIADSADRVGHHPWRVEAEDMKLDGYRVMGVDPSEAASNLQIV
ncbi:hypothetical protein F5Y10DRAFT_290559 [Nemania abortiva]|nr:hypothetical protein F5Y10DRAFT_290559 [Nemania abortiva]